MANGFMQRFNNKIKIGTLWLGTGGLYDSPSGIRGGVNLGQRLAMTVTATANTDFTMSLPPGAAIIGMTVFTTPAFLAATDAKISIGTSAGDATYVALTSIKAAGLATLPAAATAAAAAALLALPAGSPNLWIRIVQTGTTSATGAATLVIEYVLA